MPVPGIDAALAVEIALAAGGVAVWFGLFGVALLLTRPADVPPAPPTQDFGGDEPPAVVSLLTSGWELTEDAVESTLIDLAARRVIEFRQPGNDPMQTTIHLRDPDPTGLNPYESQVFQRIKTLAVDGVLPLTALTFRDKELAAAWSKRVSEAIVADARGRGLSRRRFSPTIVSALTVLAAIPALAMGAAVALNAHRDDGDYGAVIGAMIVVWFALGAFAARPRGERDTPLGRQVAARWLGLKTYLRNQDSFADLPPSAVAVWDRYLSYGDSVGATRVCSAVIDLGMGNRKRVWSSFTGPGRPPQWHRVRVRYPKFFRRYGQPPWKLLLKAAAALAIAFLVTRLPDLSGEDLVPGDLLGVIGLVLALPLAAPLLYGLYTLVATIVDLATPVTLTGEVLWIEVWRSHSGGEDSPPRPWLHYLAVDDGRADRTVAWACPSELVGLVACGDIVTVTARRWTRRVIRLEVSELASLTRRTYGFLSADAPTAPRPTNWGRLH